MKTATIRQIHNDFGKVLRWVETGEEVIVKRRETIVAQILPPPRKSKIILPDFMARLNKVFPQGVKGKPLSRIIDESRGERS